MKVSEEIDLLGRLSFTECFEEELEDLRNFPFRSLGRYQFFELFEDSEELEFKLFLLARTVSELFLVALF